MCAIRRRRKIKCRHCEEFFLPGASNAHKQKYCGKVDCRRESKRVSSAKWRRKPENQTAEKRAEEVKRVQGSQRRHGRKRVLSPKNEEKSKNSDLLRDFVPAENGVNGSVLRDLLSLLITVNKGFAIHLNGGLRDFDCDLMTRMYDTGTKVGNTFFDEAFDRLFNHTEGVKNVSEDGIGTRAGTSNSEPFQLGGSSPGP